MNIWMIIPFNWRKFTFTGWTTDVVQICLFFYLKAFDVWSDYIWLVLTLLPAGLLPHKKMTTKGGHFAMQMPHPIPVTTSQTNDDDGQCSWGWFFGKPRNLCKSLDVCLIQWLGWVCCCIVLTCESNLGYDHSHLGQWKTGTSKNNIAFSCTRKGHFLQNDMILCGTVGHREKNWHIIIHIRNHSESFQPRGDQATPFINFGLKNPI